MDRMGDESILSVILMTIKRTTNTVENVTCKQTFARYYRNISRETYCQFNRTDRKLSRYAHIRKIFVLLTESFSHNHDDTADDICKGGYQIYALFTMLIELILNYLKTAIWTNSFQQSCQMREKRFMDLPL